jgi:hypothetical protein
MFTHSCLFVCMHVLSDNARFRTLNAEPTALLHSKLNETMSYRYSLSLSLCVCVYIYIYTCVYLCICIYIYIYVYIHVCTYVCMCVYAYTHNGDARFRIFSARAIGAVYTYINTHTYMQRIRFDTHTYTYIHTYINTCIE